MSFASKQNRARAAWDEAPGPASEFFGNAGIGCIMSRLAFPDDKSPGSAHGAQLCRQPWRLRRVSGDGAPPLRPAGHATADLRAGLPLSGFARTFPLGPYGPL